MPRYPKTGGIQKDSQTAGSTDRDDEGGDAEEGEHQQLPHPEPVVYGGPHPAAAAHTLDCIFLNI